jgi:glycosyltransferase involved in cell wall biosynthesis
MNTQFSIIIPTYNSETTLHRCLDSILAQNFNDFEILIMDGLSSDSTLKIAQNYQDPRIKIYSEKDAGIYDAMNKGIKASGGKWLYFLGSDDHLYNNTVLSSIYTHIENMTPDVIYGNVVSPILSGKYNGKYDYAKIYKENICHQAIFFKKQLFDKTGPFNLKYKILADYDHNLKWFLNKKTKIAYIPDIIANYDSKGISTLNEDFSFSQDRGYNYIIYGFRSVPKRFFLLCCKKELFYGKTNIKKKLIISLLILITLFRIR